MQFYIKQMLNEALIKTSPVIKQRFNMKIRGFTRERFSYLSNIILKECKKKLLVLIQYPDSIKQTEL
jgi:hypothetical protein